MPSKTDAVDIGDGNDYAFVEGNQTAQVIFAGKGILAGILVANDQTGGTMTLLNDSSAGYHTNTFKIDALGGWAPGKIKFTTGLKITTANFTGGLLWVLYRKLP